MRIFSFFNTLLNYSTNTLLNYSTNTLLNYSMSSTNASHNMTRPWKPLTKQLNQNSNSLTSWLRCKHINVHTWSTVVSGHNYKIWQINHARGWYEVHDWDWNVQSFVDSRPWNLTGLIMLDYGLNVNCAWSWPMVPRWEA